MKDFFVGKPIHWLLWVGILGVLSALGRIHFHTNNFVPFIFVLMAMSTACVLVIVFTYRKGDRITREPFEEDGGN